MESPKINGEEQTVDPAMERGLLAGKKLALNVPPGEEVVITGTNLITTIQLEIKRFDLYRYGESFSGIGRYGSIQTEFV